MTDGNQINIKSLIVLYLNPFSHEERQSGLITLCVCVLSGCCGNTAVK